MKYARGGVTGVENPGIGGREVVGGLAICGAGLLVDGRFGEVANAGRGMPLNGLRGVRWWGLRGGGATVNCEIYGLRFRCNRGLRRCGAPSVECEVYLEPSGRW